MNKDIEAKFKKIFFATIKGVTAKNFDAQKKQCQFEYWDSFSQLELVSKVEQDFKINIGAKEMLALDSPAAFVNIIKKKYHGKEYPKSR